MSNTDRTDDRTLENAAHAVAAALRASDLITSVEHLSSTSLSAAYRVEGHLEEDPTIGFKVDLTVT